LDPDPDEAYDYSRGNKSATQLYEAQYVLSPENLFNRTKEMLSFFEGMLPDSECQFTHHEILDIAYALRRLGPIRNFWAYPGERFMKTITKSVPSGGLNPLKTVADYHAAEEVTKLPDYVADSETLDNKLRYRDNMIKMHLPQHENNRSLHEENWSVWLQEQLSYTIYTLLHNLRDEVKLSVQHISPFYRLMQSYIAITRNRPQSQTFISFITNIAKNNVDNVTILLRCRPF